MKKAALRIFSALFALALLLSLFVLPTAAAEEEITVLFTHDLLSLLSGI